MTEPRRYRWASLVIDSDLRLPELPALSGRGRAHITIRRASSRRTRTPAAAAVDCHEWRLPDGTRWASMTRGQDEHVVRFREFAEFIVAAGGRSIGWRAPAGTRPDTVRHLLLDQVLPAVAFEHSLIGLHASAVVVDGTGVAFAGPASRGKSTLAAAFAADGHAVVTDDCLMMECGGAAPTAVPSYPSLRLWQSAADRILGAGCGATPVAQYTSKLRIGTRARALRFRRRPVRVRKIYVIERRTGAPRVDPLSTRQAYIELLKATFRLDPFDRATTRREVAAISAIVEQVPVARLRVPLRLDALDGVRRAIADDLASARP